MAWQVLKNPTDLGGTALPDFNLYYIAAQLSQLFHLDKTDRERFLTLLCPKWAQYTKDSIYAIAADWGGIELGERRHTMLYHYRKIWNLAVSRLDIPQFNDYTPLWHNRNLQEFTKIHDTFIWSIQGVFYLHHILKDGQLKTFDLLKEEFTIQDQMFSDSYKSVMRYNH